MALQLAIRNNLQSTSIVLEKNAREVGEGSGRKWTESAEIKSEKINEEKESCSGSEAEFFSLRNVRWVYSKLSIWYTLPIRYRYTKNSTDRNYKLRLILVLITEKTSNEIIFEANMVDHVKWKNNEISTG